MSIESVLKNLTDAINANTEAFNNNTEAMKTVIADSDTPPPPAKDETPPPPAKDETPPPPAKDETPPPPADAITAEALNTILVAEFNRLGNRAGIDEELKKLGVAGVTELPAEKYQELIDNVKALVKVA